MGYEGMLLPLRRPVISFPFLYVQCWKQKHGCFLAVVEEVLTLHSPFIYQLINYDVMNGAE